MLLSSEARVPRARELPQGRPLREGARALQLERAHVEQQRLSAAKTEMHEKVNMYIHIFVNKKIQRKLSVKAKHRL